MSTALYPLGVTTPSKFDALSLASTPKMISWQDAFDLLEELYWSAADHQGSAAYQPSRAFETKVGGGTLYRIQLRECTLILFHSSVGDSTAFVV